MNRDQKDYSNFEDMSNYDDYSYTNNQNNSKNYNDVDQKDLAARERDTDDDSNSDPDLYKIQHNSRGGQYSKDKEKANKPTFFTKNKKIAGGLIGITMAGGTLALTSPLVMIGEFGQMANWLKETFATVKDLQQGARSMSNTMRAARVSARAAISRGISSYLQQSRIGILGGIVGDKYLKKLADAGVEIKSNNLRGVHDGFSLDAKKILGNDKLDFKDPNEKGISPKEKNKRARAQQRMQSQLEAKAKSMGIPTDKISFDTTTGKLNIDTKNMKFRDFMKTVRMAENSVGGAAKTRLGSYVARRSIARMHGIYSMFHPWARFQEKTWKDLFDWIKKHNNDNRKKTVDLDTKPNTDDDADNDGEKDTDTSKNQSVSDEINSSKKAYKIPPKVSANITKGAGIAGLISLIACTLQAAEDSYQALVKGTIQGMTGLSLEVESTWGQIQAQTSGADDSKDITLSMMRAIHEDRMYSKKKVPKVYETDDNGNITKVNEYYHSGWTEGEAYQKIQNGRDVEDSMLPQEHRNLYKDQGGWVNGVKNFFDGIPVIGDLLGGAIGLFCNTGTNLLIQAVSLINPATFFANVAMEAVLQIPAVEEKLNAAFIAIFQIASGETTDFNSLTPATMSTIAAMGKEYESNSDMFSMGAGEVSYAQAYENQLLAQEISNNEWRQKSLAERMFDTSDYRSTIAQVVNGAGLDTNPLSITDHLANVGKLFAATPSFVLNGIFSSTSSQAKAANVLNWDSGAPKIQFTEDQMEKLTNDVNYSFDVNFYGCDLTQDETCSNKIVKNNVKDLLDSDNGEEYREFAKNCLGYEIGSSPAYKVEAFEASSAEDFKFVGIKGTYYNDCSGKMSSGQNDCNEYCRIALYAYDYQDNLGKAWVSLGSDDPEFEKTGGEIFGDLGGSSGSSDVAGGDIGDEFSNNFASGLNKLGSYGSYSLADNGCTLVSSAIISACTDLTYGHGHGGQVVNQLALANPGVQAIQSTPCAPAIFSEGSGSSYGHTGFVWSVDGNKVKTVEAALSGWADLNGSHEARILERSSGDPRQYFCLKNHWKPEKEECQNILKGVR